MHFWQKGKARQQFWGGGKQSGGENTRAHGVRSVAPEQEAADDAAAEAANRLLGYK